MDLPVEIRLHVYRDLVLPKPSWNPWGCHFSADPAIRFPPGLLRVCRQIRQEVQSLIHWRLNINSHLNVEMSGAVVDALKYPGCLTGATDILLLFNFFAPPAEPLEPSVSAERTSAGLDHICSALAEVPIARKITLAWWDGSSQAEWETKRAALRPLAKLPHACTFLVERVSTDAKDVSREKFRAEVQEIVGRRVSLEKLKIVNDFPLVTRASTVCTLSWD